MKTTDEQIDKIIHEALSKEEAEYYDQLGEQSLLDMSLGVFQGRNKNIYILTLIVSFIIFGVFVYCAFQFFNASEIKEMLIYGGIALWSIISVMAVKLWHWMEMHTNRLIREIKRLELQIASSKK
ncbi:MAG: DUF6768 family protein [Fulvivirga sp.]|uniref:DUF6768 family protein n=1 Tax=Fulvivirga sp. TaxID=1931237 RepID=UPI0032EC7EB7